ncbi:hypothetical protein MHH70_00895 [Metasolibacillus sp. FSL H7-0170]|uniref:ABC transporter permease n=1 Tax=Metasolibacillus sp. FSL H7-0170 TaxID=2921431 RepID=UPI00315935C2
MLQLLRLEWTKMKRAKFSYFLIGLLLIIVSSYFFYIDKKTMKQDEIEAFVAENIMYYQDSIVATEEELKSLTGTEKEYRESFLENTKRQHEGFQMMQEGLERKNWPLYWQGEILNFISFEERALKDLEIYKNSYLYPTPFTVLVHMDKMRWMEEKSVQPLASGLENQGTTLYDQDFSEPLVQQLAQSLSSFHSSTGTYFLFHLFQYGFSLVGLIFLLFLFSDILTKEGFGRNGPIHLLRTMPIRRSSFWLSKAFTVMAGSLLIVSLTAIIGVGLGTLFNRLGDWQYPILIYGPERTYSFLSIAQFLSKAGGLFVLVLAFGFSLLFLFSVLTNRAILAIGLTIIVLVLGQALTEQTFLLSWTQWIPFHYLTVYPILNGEYTIIHNNTLFTYQQGLLSLAISTLIVLIVTFCSIKLRKGVMS